MSNYRTEKEIAEVKEVFKGYGVPIQLSHPDDFKIIVETLTRLGISSIDRHTNQKVLTQTAHILHKKGHYAILHFFELFKLDGREANYGKEDIDRRNLIVSLLENWGLCTIIDKTQIDEVAPRTSLAIIPASEKQDYKLVQKYTIGGRKTNTNR